MNNQVKEIVFTGPDGKLVGKYNKGQSLNPPIALLIHPHPLYAGTMNNPIVKWLAVLFALFHVYNNWITAVSALWVAAIHFGVFGALCELTYNTKKNENDLLTTT